MKRYIAKKPCNFGGKRYYIGDEIPTDAVLPERENALVKYGTISVIEVPDPEPETPAAPESPQMPAKAPETPGDEATTNEPPADKTPETPAPDAAQAKKKADTGKKNQQGKQVK